jgi:hypothetical protein
MLFVVHEPRQRYGSHLEHGGLLGIRGSIYNDPNRVLDA